MYHTLTNVQRNEAVNLQRNIDNRNGGLRIGLRSLIYWIGWHNIPPGAKISWKISGFLSTDNGVLDIVPGLYGFEQLAEKLPTGAVLTANETTGKAKLVVLPGTQIQFSSTLASLLNLPKDWLEEGIHEGSSPVQLWPRALYVHLDQLSTSENFVDGAPSTLLNMIPVPAGHFGDTSAVEIHNPHYKLLRSGIITELNIRIVDSNGRPIKNALPVSVVLEVVEV